jgi:hypothetical protein
VDAVAVVEEKNNLIQKSQHKKIASAIFFYSKPSSPLVRGKYKKFNRV